VFQNLNSAAPPGETGAERGNQDQIALFTKDNRQEEAFDALGQLV